MQKEILQYFFSCRVIFIFSAFFPSLLWKFSFVHPIFQMIRQCMNGSTTKRNTFNKSSTYHAYICRSIYNTGSRENLSLTAIRAQRAYRTSSANRHCLIYAISMCLLPPSRLAVRSWMLPILKLIDSIDRKVEKSSIFIDDMNASISYIFNPLFRQRRRRNEAEDHHFHWWCHSRVNASPDRGLRTRTASPTW